MLDVPPDFKSTLEPPATYPDPPPLPESFRLSGLVALSAQTGAAINTTPQISNPSLPFIYFSYPQHFSRDLSLLPKYYSTRKPRSVQFCTLPAIRLPFANI